MRAANILTTIAAILWCGLALLGRKLAAGVAQRMGGAVDLGQLDFYVLWPTGVVVVLLSCAWVCNASHARPLLLSLIAGASLAAVPPFLFLYGGGV